LYPELYRVVESYPDFDLSEVRINHIFHTAATAIGLAKIHGISTYDATLAALLHDIAKEAPEELLREYGIPELTQYSDAPKKVLHAFFGAETAKSYFGVRKKNIIDAVRFHSTGAPKMTRLAKIIYLADYIEPTRDAEMDADFLKTLRTLAARNLNAAMAVVLEASIRRILAKGQTVYPLTLAAYEYYKAKSEKRKEKSDIGDVEPHGREVLSKTSVKESAASSKPPPVPRQLSSSYDISDPRNLALQIAAALDEKKGRDITLIHIAQKTVIADYFVVASALSTTAVRALTDYVDETLSKYYGVEPLRRDIDPKWAAVDYGSVIVHIQESEIRKFYDLERLWSDGANVEKIK